MTRAARDQWRGSFQPRETVPIAIGACGAVQYGARDFQRSIDRRCAHPIGQACLYERLQRFVVYLANLEIADITR